MEKKKEVKTDKKCLNYRQYHFVQDLRKRLERRSFKMEKKENDAGVAIGMGLKQKMIYCFSNSVRPKTNAIEENVS